MSALIFDWLSHHKSQRSDDTLLLNFDASFGLAVSGVNNVSNDGS